ncbi:MAG: flippase-like domain-containing protein [Rhodospirillales bacterium]|nr:flippase-like domain-containing protein [Rhodospirillales bacterium]
MRNIKILLLVCGLALFALVVAKTDFRSAIDLAGNIGWGFVLVLALYFAAFLIDALAWQLTVPSVPLTLAWLYRFYQVRLVGEAFNSVLPAGSVGGEPVKAVLLKRCYGIDYREGITSLVLSKTLIVVSLVIFLAAGFALMTWSEKLESYSNAALIGLAVFSTGVLAFFVIQRFKLMSLFVSILSQRQSFRRLSKYLSHLEDVDGRLVHFYTKQRNRYFGALALTFANWLLGVGEIYVTLYFIGHPVSFWDAWIIEAVAQMVRSAVFFIPAAIGAQEGAIVLIGAALTGSPSAGLATALIRRIREIIWIGWGLIVFYIFKPTEAVEALQSRDAPKP